MLIWWMLGRGIGELEEGKGRGDVKKKELEYKGNGELKTFGREGYFLIYLSLM